MHNNVGFVFPGQGSQSLGMLADIAKEYAEVEKVFAEASSVLDYDLWRLVQVGPAEELDKTSRTQPALLAASYALWSIVTARKNIKPALLAGHSLGEYTALVAANAIAFKDAIKLVAARGEYMQEAAPQGVGALAAIVGLEDVVVKELCEKSVENNEVLSPANFNSPGQVVIAGHKNAVERAIILAKEKGARLAKLLPVSVPSHCVLMKPAADKLATLLNSLSIQAPTILVINNVDVAIYKNPDEIKNGLVRQLFMPVRWVETMHAFNKAGVSEIIECGPGKVLTGLNKRILPEAVLRNANDLTALNSILEASDETH